jgi:hypothetical protein
MEQGFNAILVTTGSNFVGTFRLLPQDLPPSKVAVSAAKIPLQSTATTQMGFFAGGDALLGGISRRFLSATRITMITSLT